MNVSEYKALKQRQAEALKTYREVCAKCHQPGKGCFCHLLKPFDPKVVFAILIHPQEMRRRIATGRMAHLCLKNSLLIKGSDYSQNTQVNELINNPSNACFVLYPGANATNLSKIPRDMKHTPLFPSDKRPIIFVIDGTWATARQTMRLSQNLRSLKKICFTPPHPSTFRVRKQPAQNCYSTIEAIHHMIELLGATTGFDLTQNQHTNLIEVFDDMVERQISFAPKDYYLT